jgi:hypothetical protein
MGGMGSFMGGMGATMGGFMASMEAPIPPRSGGFGRK